MVVNQPHLINFIKYPNFVILITKIIIKRKKYEKKKIANQNHFLSFFFLFH